MPRAHVMLAGAFLTCVVATGSGVDVARATSTFDLFGPPGSQSFGEHVLVLTNGNYVIADPLYDSASRQDVGAVHLYDGRTNQVISTLTGSTAQDRVGGGGLFEVGDSDFVVTSPNWRSPAVSGGAATWIDGATGLNGVVTTSNSLYGTLANSAIGLSGVTRLVDGDYVVQSTSWHGDVDADEGAATWGDGDVGVVGPVDQTNSWVGTHPNDRVGDVVTPLTNGNYVVSSGSWNGGRGVATWGDGASGTHGQVSTANSLYGVVGGDQVSSSGVDALANGNFVTRTIYVDRGAALNTGAATWGNGSTAGPRTVGGVSDSNSLVGSLTNDTVGAYPTVALANGNYLVRVPGWQNNTGAVTWANGATGRSGAVSVANSLVGAGPGAAVGSGEVLAIGGNRYVVLSPSFDNGAMADVGAITMADGAIGTFGVVGTSNSMVGAKPGDGIGYSGVALTNGDYVVIAASWDSPVATDVGAIAWFAGAAPVGGTFSASNALTGGTANDRIGSNGVTALATGNYLVRSPEWHNAAGITVGATTWRTGSGPQPGVVGPGNSMVGSTAGDQVGIGRVTVLTNGNYVVSNYNWNNGTALHAGASTWGDSTTAGTVSASNSLVGTITDDEVSNFYPTIALPNGAYLVRSRMWDNGAVPDANAVTFGGLTGARGPITASNSVRGTVTNDVASSEVPARFTASGLLPIGRPQLNRVTMLVTDITPPVIPSPPNVVVEAAPATTSAVATFPTPVATHDVGTPTVSCAPASGSTFPLGTTTVTCTAVNTENLTSTATFTVEVVAGRDYLPLTPARLADTRTGASTVDGQQAGDGPRSAGSTFSVVVAGRGGVPADARAVMLNVTATEPDADGFVTAYPCGSPQPTASNLNFGTGVTVPNAVITQVGEGGAVCLFSSQPMHLVVDVNGYFPPQTTYDPINPARVLDTRAGHGTVDGLHQGSGAVLADSTTSVQVTGRAGLAAGASAVVLNVTVTEPTASGYATVFPCGTAPPTASNLNYTAGLTIANLVISKIGLAGNVCIFSQSAAHLVVDVNGSFPADTTDAALDPVRLLDTRAGASTIDGSFVGAGVRPLGTVTIVRVAGRGGVPMGARTAVLNVTATNTAAAGYLTVYPCGIDPPLASNVNFVTGQTIPNAVISQIGTGGDVCVYNSQAADLIVDVNGYLP